MAGEEIRGDPEIDIPAFEFSREGVLTAVEQAIQAKINFRKKQQRMFSEPALNPYAWNLMYAQSERLRHQLRYTIGVLNLVAPREDIGWGEFVDNQTSTRMEMESQPQPEQPEG